jgi:hypothetical protein
MSEGAERRGKEPIEERPGTEQEGGEGGRKTSATPPISDEDQTKGETQRPPEGDDVGIGEAGTQEKHP